MRNKDWIKRDRNNSYLSFAEMYPAGYRYRVVMMKIKGVIYIYVMYIVTYIYGEG